jgi:hypothetical protein
LKLIMTLALILGVCSLLAASPGGRLGAHAWFIFKVPQADPPASQPRQDAAPSPPSEQKTESAPAQIQHTAPQASAEKTPAGAHPKTRTAGSSRAKPKKRQPKKPIDPAPAGDGPKKVIVNNGGAADPPVQLSPGVSPETASRQRQSTDLLLSTTEGNLKTAAGLQLSPAQQDTVTQIRGYMKQAKDSADAGDLQRAHNLAFKAKLLSDELAQH